VSGTIAAHSILVESAAPVAINSKTTLEKDTAEYSDRNGFNCEKVVGSKADRTCVPAGLVVVETDPPAVVVNVSDTTRLLTSTPEFKALGTDAFPPITKELTWLCADIGVAGVTGVAAGVNVLWKPASAKETCALDSG
jgi:hypothetical protein